MNRFFNYVKFGRGIGAKYLLLYALLVAIIFGAMIKVSGNAVVPALQNVADQLLPVTIDNGVIVEPQNTIRSISNPLFNNPFPIILDTTVDTIDTVGLRNGVYISRKAIYTVSSSETRVHDFGDITARLQGNYTDFFRKVIFYTSIIAGVLIFVVLYALYLVLASFYALFALLFAKIFRTPLDYCGAMRLSAIAYIVTSIVTAILYWCGLQSSPFIFFVAMLILQLIVIKLLKNPDKPKVSPHKI